MPNTNTFRLVETNAGLMRCPRHINRIHPSNAWQVRFARDSEPYFSKFFSDNRYGDIFKSLAAASDCLDDVQKSYRVTDQLYLPRSRFIRFNWHKRSRSKNPDGVLQLDCQIHICSWHRLKRVQSFYVGTEHTVTQDRIDRMKCYVLKVMDWRNRFIADHGRELLMTAKLPESLASIAPFKPD